MGLDNIPALILKDGSMVLAKPITHIINRFVVMGIYTSKWKLLKVMPLYKGDRTDPKNYRTICLILTISKICEAILMEQLVEHMTDSSLWS